jgi:hypothetical protein
MTTLAYLATPYTHYRRGLGAAFQEASRLSAKLLRANIYNYCPIVHGHPQALYGDIDPLDYDIWRRQNLAMMPHCDCLLVAHMEGWDTSLGIKEEVEFFEKLGKPIFDLDPETATMTIRLAKRSSVSDTQAATS